MPKNNQGFLSGPRRLTAYQTLKSGLINCCTEQKYSSHRVLFLVRLGSDSSEYLFAARLRPFRKQQKGFKPFQKKKSHKPLKPFHYEDNDHWTGFNWWIDGNRFEKIRFGNSAGGR